MASAGLHHLAFFLSFFLSLFTAWCWLGGCSTRDIGIYQAPSGYTSHHIPKYTVQIVNEAWQIDGVFDVKISCGDFASTHFINPSIFRRIGSESCLVKNGTKISPGEVISFEYSNVIPYEFNVLELKCV